MISVLRIVLLGIFTLAMIILWDFEAIRPLKIFVVYLHEISHAIGALITGGEVQAIFVSWDESGFTKTRGGNFLTMASAGYLGSILFGSIMLYSGLQNRFARLVSVIMGMTILFFTMAYPQELTFLILFSGIVWGVLFIVSGMLLRNINRYILFFVGGLTSLYGFYDLGDFFRGNIIQTDAGIIAHHYLKNSSFETPLAYLIAIFISVLSFIILYRIILNALHIQQAQEPEIEPENIVPAIDPQLLALLEQIQKQGKKTDSNK